MLRKLEAPADHHPDRDAQIKRVADQWDDPTAQQISEVVDYHMHIGGEIEFVDLVNDLVARLRDGRIKVGVSAPLTP